MVGYAADRQKRYRLLAQGDVRPPAMRLHLGGEAEMTHFAIVQFLGFGNDRSLTHDTRDNPTNPLHGFFLQVTGNTELRLPVARFPLLLPWHIGLLGYAESGRVFVAGDSPGVSVLLTNGRERQLIIGTGAA